MVTAVVNGSGEVVSITIDPAAVDPDDVEMLQDLSPPPSTRRSARSRTVTAEKMARVTGGLRIPGC